MKYKLKYLIFFMMVILILIFYKPIAVFASVHNTGTAIGDSNHPCNGSLDLHGGTWVEGSGWENNVVMRHVVQPDGTKKDEWVPYDSKNDKERTYKIKDGATFKGKSYTVTVKTSYVEKGDATVYGGLDDGRGVRGAPNSKVKVEISGLPTGFRCAFRVTDLDTKEGWSVSNTYQATGTNDVWLKSNYANKYNGTSHLNVTLGESSVKIVGGHEVANANQCGDQAAHTGTLFLKEKSNKIVLYYFPGTASHGSSIKDIGDYTVSYSSASGTTNMPKGYQVPTNTYFQVSDMIPNRRGYTFNNWTYDNKTVIADGVIGPVTKNIKLVAQWTPNQYKLYLWPGNGNTTWTTANPNLIFNGGNWNNVAGYTPSMTGYTFKGWLLNNTNTKIYNADGTCTNDGTYWKNNAYVYAGDLYVVGQWEEISYTLSLNANGGNLSSAGAQSGSTHKYTEQVKICHPSRTGYTFAGWQVSGYGSTALFYRNGTSGWTWYSIESTLSMSTYNYADNYLFTKLRDASGTVTFKAQWTPNKYTITFKQNKPSSMSSTISGRADNSTVTVTYDSTSNNSVTTCSATGWKFNGWYTAASGGTKVYNADGTCNTSASSYWTTSKTWKYTGNVTLYAQWTANTYYVDYVKGSTNNGGTTATTSHTYDAAVTLASNGFTGRSYSLKYDANTPSNASHSVTDMPSNQSGTLSFAYWSVVATNNSGNYNANTNIGVKNFESTNGATAHATAIWNSKTLTTNASPKLQGWVFKGWSTNQNATSGSNNISDTVSPSTSGWSKTYYAIWEAVEYDIYYSKGLTDDKEHKEVIGATRNSDLQVTSITSMPYTHAIYDNTVTFASLGNTKLQEKEEGNHKERYGEDASVLLGRSYQIKYSSNIPNGATKETKESYKLKEYIIEGYLESKGYWEISGQDSGVTSNLRPKFGEEISKPNYTSYAR